MDPIPFRYANKELGPPQDPSVREDGSPILTLPVYSGHQHTISKWKLTTKEIESIQRDGVIWLHVLSSIHPPVMLSTDDPFAAKEGGAHGN